MEDMHFSHYDSENEHVLAAYQLESKGKYYEAIDEYKKALAETKKS